MNIKEIMKKRNDAARLLDLRMKTKRNAVYLGGNESFEHALTKATMCWFLCKEGKDFYTEAIFIEGKGRADVFILDDCLAIEVYKTEDIGKEVKSEKYPCKVLFLEAKREGLEAHVRFFLEKNGLI